MIVIIVAAIVAAGGIALAAWNIGYRYRKMIGERAIGSAEAEAVRIVEEAQKTSEAKKREALVEAREEIHKNRTELEREIRDRRAELQKLERRQQQKEESLDRKIEALEKKDEQYNRKISEAEEKNAQIAQIQKEQIEKLEQISGMTSDEAKEYLVRSIASAAEHDAAIRLREIDQQLRDDADRRARELITQAVQRVASDYVSEATVSVVPLPNDEMKGRIIGREGRNIRALETITGVDLIIDDTPEAITLSCFDPVRREIARITLEKLIIDGRIHPARIEEMAEKAKKEVEATIKTEGENAVFDLNLHGIHPELIRLLGRMRYRTSFGQNVLHHSIEVAQIAGFMAEELGVDPALARRAGLLHDIGKAADHEIEGSHVAIGVDLARKYKEGPEVIHAIEAHHGDVEPCTLIACLVDAADDISAARPGARRENLEAYIKRLEKLEDIANSFPGVEKSFAIQAGREIRIIVRPEELSDDQIVLLSHELVQKIEAELEYPGQIKICVIRETRAVAFAK
ncbi:MAG: ribonuclease Y [Clostridiales bacterium]|jgi:ribonuclease Y|nr:ribonuclease Y [Clostridiales bacterium]